MSSSEFPPGKGTNSLEEDDEDDEEEEEGKEDEEEVEVEEERILKLSWASLSMLSFSMIERLLGLFVYA